MSDFERLKQMLPTLDEKEALALFLRAIEHFSYPDIAERMDISVAEAERLVRRSRKVIRDGMNHKQD